MCTMSKCAWLVGMTSPHATDTFELYGRSLTGRGKLHTTRNCAGLRSMSHRMTIDMAKDLAAEGRMCRNCATDVDWHEMARVWDEMAQVTASRAEAAAAIERPATTTPRHHHPTTLSRSCRPEVGEPGRAEAWSDAWKASILQAHDPSICACQQCDQARRPLSPGARYWTITAPHRPGTKPPTAALDADDILYLRAVLTDVKNAATAGGQIYDQHTRNARIRTHLERLSS